jgi:hypothetical protein
MCPSDDFFDRLFDARSLASEQMSQRQLCETVLAQTTEVIRNRRRLRRAGLAAALVGCYLAGMATISFWKPASVIGPAASNSTAGLVQRHNEVEPSLPGRKLVRPEDDQIDPGDVQLAAARQTPYDRLRRAGDRQLEEDGDIPAAMRTYQRALQVASADQRSVAPDQDSWLLMAIKNSTN